MSSLVPALKSGPAHKYVPFATSFTYPANTLWSTYVYFVVFELYSKLIVDKFLASLNVSSEITVTPSPMLIVSIVDSWYTPRPSFVTLEGILPSGISSL